MGNTQGFWGETVHKGTLFLEGHEYQVPLPIVGQVQLVTGVSTLCKDQGQ